MELIVGLGNPGEKYKKTRHNVGFMMIDRIKENYNFPDFSFENKFNAYVTSTSNPPRPLAGEDARRAGEGLRENTKIILTKPQTFMNNSGDSVRAILDFYKLTPNDLIVIHDDIDLPLGEYKIASSSGSAGHNGVQDIIDKIGTKDFKRIRVGVANDALKNPIDPADFVLQNFSEEEMEAMNNISRNVLEEIKEFI